MKKDFQFKALFFRVFAVICFFFISQSAFSQVSGIVFRDYNSNGKIDTTASSYKEIGQIGVTVKVYNASGAEVGTATTDKNGKYTIAGVSGPLRVEFSNLPNLDFPSFSGGTSVQFVNGGATNINFGTNIPGDYCQANPNIVTVCFASQDLAPGTDKVMIKFPLNYTLDPDGNANGTTTQGGTYGQVIYTPTRPDPSGIGMVNQVGSTWGVAYDKISKKLYTSTYIRRGTRLGPTESTGAIYVITDVVNASTPALFVDLNTVFGANTTGANPHPFSTTSWNGGNWDLNTLDKVGKVGFGDIEMSKDGTKLYAVNLADKRLYEIPTSGPLNSTTIKRYDIPTTGLPVVKDAAGTAGVANSVDVRPFALGFDKSGNLFVGAVHTCESISAGVDANPNPASYQMTGYVWKFSNGAFTLVLNESLRFDRDNSGSYTTFDNVNASASNTYNYDWEPWSNVDNYGNQQPMLTDIDFTDDKMILGFRDRGADQSFGPNGGGGFQSSGDIYMACLQGSIWKFEQAGGCGGLQSTRGTNKQGPGGGEFFEDTQGDGVLNGGNGGIAILQGYGVISTSTDAVVRKTNGTFLDNVAAAGVQMYDFTSGNYKGGYDVYYKGNSQASSYAKASGVGDVEILCNVAPLEIGNRIWNDKDKDGIQDADEVGIGNVRVELYDGNTLVGTTLTDATGNWYFNESNVPDGSTDAGTQLGVQPNKNYSIRIGNTDWSGGNGIGDLANLQLTNANANSSGLQDVSDSDALIINSIPTITYTTGDYGQNNHTLDMGFSCIELNAGADQSFCQPSDGKYKLADAPSGQTWTKLSGSSSIDASTGQITGLTAGTNEYILKYTATSDCSDTVKITVNAVPDLAITSTQATCPASGGNANYDAKINLVTTSNGIKVDYTSGSTYTGTKSYASLPTGMPSGNVFTVPNPSVAKNFTVRLYNQGGTCFIDKTIEVKHIDCPLICPPNTCLPISSEKN